MHMFDGTDDKNHPSQSLSNDRHDEHSDDGQTQATVSCEMLCAIISMVSQLL